MSETVITQPIIIVGGGIGGLSAALALAKQGVKSIVLERAPEIMEIGAGIQLGPNGFRAFSRLGVSQAMDEICFRPDAIRLMDSVSGEELSRQTLGQIFEARFGHPYRVAYRADVQQVLLDAVNAIPELIQVRLGDGVARFEQDAGGVTVFMESGATVDGAAVVGADGLWSQVRGQILDAEPPTAGGNVAFRAVLPVEAVPPQVLTNDVQVWIGPGHHLVCYKVRGGTLFNIIAVVESTRDLSGWDVVGDRADLELGFQGAGQAVQSLIAQIREWRMWTLRDRDPAPGWSQGRVTLLGDAAHPMLPFLAQGACMAIEDAVRLADEVARTPADLPAALLAYEAARYERTASVQIAARETGEINHARGPAREARNAVLAKRQPNDHEAVSWLFEGEGPRPVRAQGADIGIFGRHVQAAPTDA